MAVVGLIGFAGTGTAGGSVGFAGSGTDGGSVGFAGSGTDGVSVGGSMDAEVLTIIEDAAERFPRVSIAMTWKI